jgi:YrbI family 3-deoxy-D-manno-octulosonate 8-phosphate phosphatase
MSRPNNEVLVIIPARGGSKGIRGKNLRTVGGLPLVVHSIRQALATPAVTRVVVSTDDARIAAASRRAGAEVVDRPNEISGDTASSESALLHVLDYLAAKEKYEPGLVVFLQATSPLRRPDDIQLAIETLRRQEADSLFSACRIEGFVWAQGDGNLRSLNYDPTARPRRQDLRETCLEENGSIYVFKPEVLRRHGSRLGSRIALYEMPRLLSFQVDEPADLGLMEQLLAMGVAPSPAQDLAGVRLLVLDFDGVMTDNTVWVDQDGREAVRCNRGDGWGIGRLKKAGIEVVILSTEPNTVVAARARKLRLECIHGCKDKLAALKSLVAKRRLKDVDVAYVGNDENDLECLRWVGFPMAVADALPTVKAVAARLTTRPGGWGAVREVADWICEAVKSAKGAGGRKRSPGSSRRH